MDDTTLSATPMPEQPVATATNPAAPFPPADPLPVFVPPSVMDPVSNLGFLPVDDAFALEFRSETIEQLVGGDALRRGESERIEAGRSQTNADLVAGRDRVRVHATLHEHTGHALAEQATHLHTTVDGTLDIHAGSEDTVLLAGHMSDLWDGGTAIVAAMTDDTVAGGGIRVTTPLDLWLHGLMGVEERIGTCTADAVLMELSATHYEREYGPGVHAAGLAVYTGSLYQSSRSTFRPLMRVSSGVRNLIAGGGGGGGGGDGGAGSAPAASPPPAPAAGGAETDASSETLRAATGAGADRTAQTGGMAGGRSQDLTGIHRGDDVAALARRENVAADAGDLTGLHRGADTAGQLGALRDAMRGTEAGAEGGEGSVFRFSQHDDTASVHEACGPDVVVDIPPGATVPGVDAPELHSTVSPPQPPPGVRLQLLGGGDRPPRPAVSESDFPAVYRRLYDLRNIDEPLAGRYIARAAEQAAERISGRLLYQFELYGGNTQELARDPAGITTAEQAYLALQRMAGQAERDDTMARADRIHEALEAIGAGTIEELQSLVTRYDLSEVPSTPAMQGPPATFGPTVTVAATPPPVHTSIPPPAHTSIQTDWISRFRQLRGPDHRLRGIGPDAARAHHRRAATDRVAAIVMRRFRRRFGRPSNHGPYSPFRGVVNTPEQAYVAMQDMLHQAEASGNTPRAFVLRRELEFIGGYLTRELDELTARYGPLDAPTTLTTHGARPTQTTFVMRLPPIQRPPVAGGPPLTVAPTSVALAGRLNIPGPAHHIAPEVTLAFPQPAGGLVHATDVPGPPPASGLPGPSLSDTGDSLASDLGRSRLDPTATISGTTAAHPTATETIVTPALAGASSFWLQPVDPWPAPGTGFVDSGLHHAGETVRPPPLTTTASSTAPAPGASFHVPAWVTDDFNIERSVLAGELPPGFDASQLIRLARRLGEPEIGEVLAAGQLPMPNIDLLMNWYRTTNDRGRNTLLIENLDSLRESIERALRDAYQGRVHPDWLDHVREVMPRWRSERTAPSVASTAGPAELDVAEIERLRAMAVGDNFDVERNVLAGTLPLEFDTSPLVRLSQRLGEPRLAVMLAAGQLPLQTIDRMIDEFRAANESGRHTRRIGNLSALKASVERALLDAYPGRVRRDWLDHVRYVELPRGRTELWRDVRPAPSAASTAGLPLSDATEIHRLLGTGEGVSRPTPGWQGAGTPGFGRATSRAFELPFWRRECIANWFSAFDTVLRAALVLRTGGADTLGWPPRRWYGVLDDIIELNAIVMADSASAARMDVDWHAIETLIRFLHASHPSP